MGRYQLYNEGNFCACGLGLKRGIANPGAPSDGDICCRWGVESHWWPPVVSSLVSSGPAHHRIP